MNRVISLLSFILFTLLTVQSVDSKDIDNNDFPSDEPYISSLLSIGVQSESAPFLKKSRAPRIRLYKDRPQYRYSYWRIKDATQLAVVIPGLCANYKDTTAAYISKLFYEKGYSVIQISSPLNWQFVQSALSAPCAGFVPEDTSDVRFAIAKIIEQVEKKEKKKHQHYTLAGLSIGGLYATFIAFSEENDPQIGFESYYAINPIVNLEFCIQKLDSMYYDSLKYLRLLGEEKWNEIFWFNRLAELMQPQKAPQFANIPRIELQALPNENNLTDEELALAMGYLFRRDLVEMILVSQKQMDLNILKEPDSFFRKQPRYNEASTFSFYDYLEKIVMNYYTNFAPNPWPKDKRAAESLSECSFFALKDFLTDSHSLKIFHTFNDPLIDDKSILFLQTVIDDERLFFFHRGGHMGMLLEETFRNTFISVIQ
jgi:predicted alpha/beta-fold hydrolase